MTKQKAFTTEFIEAQRPTNKKQIKTDKNHPGLQLIIQPTGRKSFYIRVTERVGQKNKQINRKLGDWPRMTLKEAIEQARFVQDYGLEKPTTELTTLDILRQYVESRPPVEKDLQNLASFRKNFIPLEASGVLPKYAAELKGHHLLNANAQLAQTLADGTRANLFGFMSRAFNWAKMSQLADNNPARDFLEYNSNCGRNDKPIKPSAPRKRYATIESINEALAASEGAKKDLLLLFLITGMRRCELKNLLWSEVDLDQRVILIDPTRRKTRRSFPIALSPLAVSVLKERQGQNEAKAIEVFPRFAKQSQTAITEKYRRHGFTPHDLRRTVGKLLRELGVSEDVQARFYAHSSGQSNVAQTRVYTDYDRDPLIQEQHAAAEKLEAFFKKSTLNQEV